AASAVSQLSQEITAERIAALPAGIVPARVLSWSAQTRMPELPEVETIARGLRQSILGRRILSVTLGKTDFIDDPSALEQHLPGRRIEAVERYGKFMLLRLSAVTGAARAATNGDLVPA